MSAPLSIDDPAYFERLSAVDPQHWWPLAMWRIADHWLDRTIRPRAGLNAADIGCGAGGTIGRLLSRPEIASAIGIDASRSAIARAPAQDVTLASALCLPFGANRFDVATCFDVVQHLPRGSDRVAMREIHRILRPGGVAIFRANGKGLWPPKEGGPSPYDLRELAHSIRGAGFSILAATYVNCVPAVVVEVVGRILPGRGLGHPAGGGLRIAPVHPARNRLMSAISRAEAYAVGRLGVSLPVGHSTMVLARKPSEVAS